MQCSAGIVYIQGSARLGNLLGASQPSPAPLPPTLSVISLHPCGRTGLRNTWRVRDETDEGGGGEGRGWRARRAALQVWSWFNGMGNETSP